MDLFDRRTKRDHARLRAYNTLLEQIYNRIYATSQLSGNTASILYNVPPFILGLPKLDMEDCIVYLVFQLRQGGFEVRFTWPNLLYISWKHHEAAYLTKQNPIIQAMVPEPPPKVAPLPQQVAPKKKQLPAQAYAPPTTAQKQVSFEDEIAILTGGAMAPANQTTLAGTPLYNAGARRAADYQPPASFLQTMDKPNKPAAAKGDVLADLWSL